MCRHGVPWRRCSLWGEADGCTLQRRRSDCVVEGMPSITRWSDAIGGRSRVVSVRLLGRNGRIALVGCTAVSLDQSVSIGPRGYDVSSMRTGAA